MLLSFVLVLLLLPVTVPLLLGLLLVLLVVLLLVPLFPVVLLVVWITLWGLLHTTHISLCLKLSLASKNLHSFVTAALSDTLVIHISKS